MRSRAIADCIFETRGVLVCEEHRSFDPGCTRKWLPVADASETSIRKVVTSDLLPVAGDMGSEASWSSAVAGLANPPMIRRLRFEAAVGVGTAPFSYSTSGVALIAAIPRVKHGHTAGKVWWHLLRRLALQESQSTLCFALPLQPLLIRMSAEIACNLQVHPTSSHLAQLC